MFSKPSRQIARLELENERLGSENSRLLSENEHLRNEIARLESALGRARAKRERLERAREVLLAGGSLNAATRAGWGYIGGAAYHQVRALAQEIITEAQ